MKRIPEHGLCTQKIIQIVFYLIQRISVEPFSKQIQRSTWLCYAKARLAITNISAIWRMPCTPESLKLSIISLDIFKKSGVCLPNSNSTRTLFGRKIPSPWMRRMITIIPAAIIRGEWILKSPSLLASKYPAVIATEDIEGMNNMVNGVNFLATSALTVVLEDRKT